MFCPIAKCWVLGAVAFDATSFGVAIAKWVALTVIRIGDCVVPSATARIIVHGLASEASDAAGRQFWWACLLCVHGLKSVRVKHEESKCPEVEEHQVEH